MESHLEWVKRIARAQTEKCGLIGLSRLLMEKLERIVFVTDEQGNVQCWHVPQNQSGSPQEKVLLPSLVVGSNEMTKGFITFGGMKYFFYCWPIANQKKEGYLWVLTDNNNLLSEEIESIEFLCSAMLVEIMKRQEQIELKQYLRDESLLNLLFNNSVYPETIGQMWGWNLATAHIVVIMEGKMKVRGHSFSDVRPTAENFLLAKYPGVVTGMIGKCLIALFPYQRKTREKDGQISGNWKKTPLKAYAELQGILSDVELWAGVGNVYFDPPLLYRSYQEAKVALEMGKLLGGEEKLAFFEELGASRLFYNQREQDLRDFFNETLGSVFRYDQQHDSNLLLTLWYYFISGGDIQTVVKKLYIHANILRYRLRKVEELTGCSLDAQEVRFNVYAALKVGIILGIIMEREN